MKKYGRLSAIGLVALALLVPILLKTEAPALPNATPAPEPETTAAQPEPTPEYTLRLALDAAPVNWSPFHGDSPADVQLLSLLSAGLYEYDYNETGDGFDLVPAMAAGEPEDVTARYAGRFGVTGEDSGLVWRIPLRTDLCWEDGRKIDAYDFVRSAQRLLDPETDNSGAEKLFRYAGAEAYWSQGQELLVENALNGQYTMEALLPGEDGQYLTPEGARVYLALDYPLEHLLYGRTLLYYVETYGETVFDLSTWEELLGVLDDRGLIPLTDSSYSLFSTLTFGNWGDTEETIPLYFIYSMGTTSASWLDVGIAADGRDALILALKERTSAFSLKDSLTLTWLVDHELYDEVGEAYGISAETTVSCGPYRLLSFTPGEGYVLERNALCPTVAEGSYMTTRIEAFVSGGEEERLALLQEGRLDYCELSGSLASENRDAENAIFIPGNTTYLLAFNPDVSAIAARDKRADEDSNAQIVAIPEFRQALGYSVDREGFNDIISTGSCAALGLFTELYADGVSSGVSYRATAEGQSVIDAVWGSTGGYDLDRARELLEVAYDRAIAERIITEDSSVTLTFGLPGITDYFLRGYQYLSYCFLEAARTTRWEGKLSFTQASDLGSNLMEALRSNQVDLLFGVGWAGNPLDPAGLMEAYLSPAFRYDPAWDPGMESLTLSIGGVSCTASLPVWFSILQGEERNVATPEGNLALSIAPEETENRRAVLAGLEEAVLRNADAIPLTEAGTLLLYSERLIPGSGEYFYGVGCVGVKHLRYVCDDEAWAAMNKT